MSGDPSELLAPQAGKSGGVKEVGTSIWLFPKQHYHQKTMLMNRQVLLDPQHLNYVSYKESILQPAVPLPLWH